MPPLVSIIIPTYNYAHYLTQALESALAQTHTNIEVIVIDDGSTDNTAETVKPYLDRIRYHYKSNAGLSAARNTGLSLASGDYVQFLDADDLIHNEFIERSLKTLREHSDAPAAVAGSELFFQTPGDHPNKNSWKVDTKCKLDESLLFRNIAPPHAFLIRSSYLRAIKGFDETMLACEDYEYWFRLFSKFGAPASSEAKVYYRRHETSMSANREKQTIHDCIMQSRICSALFEAYQSNSPLFAKQLNNTQMMRYCIPALASCLLNQRNLKKYAKKSDRKLLQMIDQLTSTLKSNHQPLKIDSTQFAFFYYIARYSKEKKHPLKKIFKMPIFSLHIKQRAEHSISLKNAIKADFQWHVKGLFCR